MADVVTVSLQTSIAGWSAALSSDSANPQPSYTINEKTVSRSEWRESLLQLIKDAQDAVNQRNPTITWSSPSCCRRW